jgi:hypothetical protein
LLTMRATSALAILGLTTAVAPPTISLQLDESAVHTRLIKHAYPIAGNTALVQPDGKAVFSRQDYTQKCAANLDGVHVTCKLPTAKAYDHMDKQNVAVRESVWLVDSDGKKTMTKVATGRKGIQWTKRGTYLMKFDATDRAGNHAEQVVFALILDDETKPTIQMCGDATETVEAATSKIVPAKNWQLCESVVTDNIDATNTMQVLYTVAHDNKFILQNKPYAEAKAAITTNQVGTFTVTMTTHDNAGKYGESGKDNYQTATKVVKVQDTTKPWITITGAVPAVNECATTYTDEGAVGHDALDTLALGKTMVVTPKNGVDSATVGTYAVTYDTTDTNNNKAAQVARSVGVVDTTKPSIALVGQPQVVHYSEDNIVDGGVTTSDTCDKSLGAATKTWNKAFNQRKIGEYIRTYEVTDASGNKNSVTRTFDLQDNKIPLITVQGNEVMTYEATHDTQYTDQGAVCRDFVDGILDHAVEVSGDDVDLKVPGKYTINYNCRDLSGNEAIMMKRTVTVRDTTKPTIALKGAKVYYIEAGFPYVDAGATATDSLDGDISSKIWTNGDTVNVDKAFYARRSCKDIKDHAAKGKQFANGYYYITTKQGSTWARRRVWCVMSRAATYYMCQGCARVRPYGNAHGSCGKYGLEMAKIDAAEKKLLVQWKMWRKYFPANARATTNDYLCSTNDRAWAPKSYPISSVSTYDAEHDEINRSDAGKYVIFYHVSDKAGNKEKFTPRRTVIVKDTLPPVITLRLNNKLIHTSAGQQKTPANFYKVYVNPAGVSGAGGNPNLMEETSSSVNGWIIGAVASAVTGVALLGFASKSKVEVPV